jgi:hypothetical protein
VYFSCAGGNVIGSSSVTTPQAEAQIALGANNVLNGSSTLTNGIVNGANENAVTATAFPTTLNAGTGLSGTNTAVTGFLTSVNYIGAVRNSTDTWYRGWSCGLPGETPC